MDGLKGTQKREQIVADKKDLQQYIYDAVKTEMSRILPQLAVLLAAELFVLMEQQKAEQPLDGVEVMDMQIVQAISVVTADGRDHASTGQIATQIGFASNAGFRPYLLRAQDRGVIVERRARTGYWRVVDCSLLQKAS